MTKQITPEVIEEAIKWLKTETYCCHALACALSGYEYESFHTESNHIKQASEFLESLLRRDSISNTGTWSVDGTLKNLPLTRSEWLRKIAQELREGKISA